MCDITTLLCQTCRLVHGSNAGTLGELLQCRNHMTSLTRNLMMLTNLCPHLNNNVQPLCTLQTTESAPKHVAGQVAHTKPPTITVGNTLQCHKMPGKTM